MKTLFSSVARAAIHSTAMQPGRYAKMLYVSQRNYVVPADPNNPGGPSVTVQAPSVANVQANFAVALNQMEQSRQALYDTNVYPAAGASQLIFFAVPAGQAGKTKSDTNLTIGGQLPVTQKFLISRVCLGVYPNTPSAGTANQDPSFVSTAAAAASQQINDAHYMLRSGYLVLKIADKDYITDGPLDRFPPDAHMGFDSAVAMSDTNTGNTTASIMNAIAQSRGDTYDLDPDNLLIDANMSFSVTLNWPEGLQALSIANSPARIKCWLDGTLYRSLQ